MRTPHRTAILVSLGTIKCNFSCTSDGSPSVDTLEQSSIPLNLHLRGNSPNEAEGQFILESDPNPFLAGKKLQVQATFKEVLHAGCRSVVENFRIAESEAGPFLQVIMRSGSVNGFEQSIDGGITIELFGECLTGSGLENR